MTKLILTAATAIALAGCANDFSASPRSEKDASMNCPSIARASAWVNRMPGPNRQVSFHVRLKINEDVGENHGLSLSKRDATDGTLSLVLVDGEARDPTGAEPFDLLYHEALDGAPYANVEISCNGDILALVEDIKTVY